jgi:hypothetical protein
MLVITLQFPQETQKGGRHWIREVIQFPERDPVQLNQCAFCRQEEHREREDQIIFREGK